MILACDQFEQIIRLAFGEEPGALESEEYQALEEALRRIQGLGKSAEKIVITKDSSLARALEKQGSAVTQVPRLEAAYWAMRKQVNGNSCLILSIGRNSCVGGLVKNGSLTEPEVASPELGLHSIWLGWLERNSPLRRAVEAYVKGKDLPEAQNEIFQGFLSALRGIPVQKPISNLFSAPLNLPKVAIAYLMLWKGRVQAFLAQLDPHREIKTLICTDWAASGSLPDLFRADYDVLCSRDNSLTDAVRGMILLGREAVEHQKEEESVGKPKPDKDETRKEKLLKRQITSLRARIAKALTDGVLPSSEEEQLIQLGQTLKIPETDIEKIIDEEVRKKGAVRESKQLAPRKQAELYCDMGRVNFIDIDVNSGTKKAIITYTNRTPEAVSATITTDAPNFLMVVPSSLSQNSGQIEVALDTSKLEWGQCYSQNLVISYNGPDSPLTIPVDIRVKPRQLVTAKRWPTFPGFVLIAVMGIWALYYLLKEPPPIVPFTVMAVKDGRINVRKGPSGSDSILGVMNLRKGEPLGALESRGDWYKIRLRVNGRDTTGWIHRSFVLPQSEVLRRVKDVLAGNGFEGLKAEFDAAGILAVSGTVTHSDHVRRVNRMVSGIPGIGRVEVARLRVEPPPPPPQVVSVDRVLDVLSNNGYRDLKVTISGNDVSVAGTVNTDQDINRVRDIIQSVSGVGSVDVTNLRLPIPLPPTATGEPFVQPLPPALWSAGQGHVQKMITYASVEGGINSEGEIQRVKRNIEDLNIQKQLGRRNRRIARELNQKGLTEQRAGRIADAVKTLRAAHQADPADVEIVNNLGQAYMLSGDLASAEKSLTLALLLSPARSAAWFNLGQMYAKQAKEKGAVAAFANTYRFSQDRNRTVDFLRNLADNDQDNGVKLAARKALDLKLLRRGNEVPPPAPPEPSGTGWIAKRIKIRLQDAGFGSVKVEQSGPQDIILSGEVGSRQELERVKVIADREAKGHALVIKWAIGIAGVGKLQEPRSNNISDHIKLAKFFHERGEYANALSELEKALSIDPTNTEVQVELEKTRKACLAEKKTGQTGLPC